MLNGSAVGQHSLVAGEVSPQVWDRSDVSFWQSALRKATNATIDFHGGAKKRPGCRIIGNAASATGKVILVEFKFSSSVTYCLEFSAGKIRILQDGGFVVDDSDDIYEITTSYTEDDLDELTFTQKADVLDIFSPSYPIYQLKRYGNADWELTAFDNDQGPFEETNTESAETIYASAKSGTVTLTANFDAFTSDMVGTQVYLELQSSGEIASWVQRTPTSVGDEIYYDGNYYIAAEAETITDTSYSSGKALTGDTPPTHTSGSYWDGPNKAIDTYGYDNIIGVLWAYEHSGYGIVEITSVTSTTEAVGTTVVDIPSGIVGGNVSAYTETFENQTTATEFELDSDNFDSQVISDYTVTLEAYNSNGAPTEVLSYSSNEFSIDFSTFTLTLTSAPQYTETVDEVTTTYARNVVVTQAEEIRSTYYWAFEAWRDTNGYPRCGAYYQQRLATGGSTGYPQYIWLSYLDAYDLYTIDNPVLADNAMSFQVDSTQVNEVLHMISMNALIVFTSGSIWAINKGSNSALDATDPPTINVQSYDGACEIPPILSGTQALYVTSGKQVIRDLRYDYTRDSFDGEDLTVRASHLFRNKTITSWAYSKHPDKQIWVSFSDGTFAVFTYMHEQSVEGWTSADIDGEVQYFCSVYEDNEDRIYAVIQRDSQNYICRFASRQSTERRDQFFMDMGYTLDGTASTTLTTTADSYQYGDTVTLSTSDDYFGDLSSGQYIGLFYDNTKYLLQLDTITDEQNATAIVYNKALPDDLITELEAGLSEDWGQAYTDITGATALAGEDVAVVGDGEVLSDGYNNALSVDSSGELTLDDENASVIIHIGLPFKMTLRTLPLKIQAQTGDMRPVEKRISKLGIMLNETVSIKAGMSTDDDNLHEVEARTDEDFGQLPDEKTDLVRVDIDTGWDPDGGYYVIHDQPTNCEVLGLYPEVKLGN